MDHMNLTLTIDRHANKTVRIIPGGDTALFYNNSAAEERCIGHLRMDADNCGKLWTSWWPHSAAQKHNREPFRSEFDALINALYRELFSQPEKMMGWLRNIPSLDTDERYRFFHIDTGVYSYYSRVCPGKGDYSYCYCYVNGEDERNG